ncbi:aldolase catalytic domain-containing protein [Acetatifactor muris]|uniref:aldolase catalytic domain-containing protein n=1 Tax=Acetatifactor muris TaxID=879566 RepID=UPI0023F41983|nr:aldolase catalytic domain-containing protein [Acetatifactor muris]
MVHTRNIMNTIHILDCTLRDGGYCNQWQFGLENTKKIIKGLADANIDIIECGFLTNRVSYDPDITKYSTLNNIDSILPSNRRGQLYVVMVNYGEYNASDLPECDGSSIDGIRVAFHKKDMEPALKLCKEIQTKGYKVFVQAMVSLSYTDREFLALIECVNELSPYAFYIVDSFGMMKKKNLLRLYYMVEHNLKEDIWIGFHSHNNMQLAYSNAQSLADMQTSRNLIIDSSVYGMGRGAGNLNTELFVEYLNENNGGNYVLKPILTVIDEILDIFLRNNYWGYSLSNYLSAAHNIHPNYAGYLADKQTLTLEAMDEIFSMMVQEKQSEFDREYIEELYLRYMDKGVVFESHRAELADRVQGKKILLIAPGRSAEEEKSRISQFAILKDVVTVSVNFNYPYSVSDFIFVSNLRRFQQLETDKRKKCIVTTNISTTDAYFRPNYFELLSPNDAVRDNAGLMAMRLFIMLGVKGIFLAGFDGYSRTAEENYIIQQQTFVTKNAIIDARNHGMMEMINELRKEVHVEFLTSSKYLSWMR